MDISHATIKRFLYGPTVGHSWALNTSEFDYRWDIVRSGAFQRNVEQMRGQYTFVGQYIAADVRMGRSSTVGHPEGDIKFCGQVFLADGVEIDFACMLLAKIHEWAFRTSTTYPFPCLIFQLCRDSGVPIWHCDRLVHPTGALDIGLIRDEENVAAPRREPQVEVPPLGTDLADTVGQAQGDDLSIPDHTNTIPGSSSQAASMAPSSSRVQKLEPQMATLLHHIQPWMQKLIAEFETRVESRMEGLMDRKIQAVNNHLDAFKLRVLERPAPAIELAAL
ncbi:hypothetical protein H5410_040680 [Solanum commersonii]|uniref:Integrase core domain containing protein n=1 Tax=Solanum commersonii TaxID=4109 RepID=A0A9J5XT94_SOLCO|nr:hypothetical protein H5410_040680 [Solanum commersonii]